MESDPAAIGHAAAWKASDFAGKDDLAVALTARHLAAFEAAVARVRGGALEAIGRADFALPEIAEEVATWRAEVMEGRGLLLLRGNNLKLVTQQDVILARDSLEYWDRQEVAVARGDASAVRGDREVKADVLTAYFSPDEQDQLQMTTLKADGNVRVTTPREFARGNTGVYYVPQELMTLTGDVKVTRGEDQMNGRYAEVDLKTGISRMLGAAPGQPGDTRVRTLLVPGSDSEGEGTGEEGSGAEGTDGKDAGKKSGS